MNTAVRGSWTAVLGEITRHLIIFTIDGKCLSTKIFNDLFHVL